MNRWWAACALGLSLTIAGCGGSAGIPNAPIPKSSATTEAAGAEDAEVLAAFGRYYDDLAKVASSGKKPGTDALSKTATAVVREQELTQLTQDVERGTSRSGAPRFKDQTVTVTGDEALVVTCINEDDWPFEAGGRTISPKSGWVQLGRKLTKVDGQWLVSGYSQESTKETCS